jgi:hypothetical protein
VAGPGNLSTFPALQKGKEGWPPAARELALDKPCGADYF